MRGGFTLCGEIGGQNDLFDCAIVGAIEHALKIDFAWSHALKRSQSAHQHVIQALIAMCGLNGVEICRCLNDAKQ